MAISVDPREVLTAIEGRWTSVYNEVDGQYVGPLTNIIELRDNTFQVYQDGDVTYEGTFTLGPVQDVVARQTSDPRDSPTEIVLTYTKSKNPLYLRGPRQGVVQLYGDTLKWTFRGVGHNPPREFNTFPGAEAVLSVYEREGTQENVAERRVSALRSVAVW